MVDNINPQLQEIKDDFEDSFNLSDKKKNEFNSNSQLEIHVSNLVNLISQKQRNLERHCLNHM